MTFNVDGYELVENVLSQDSCEILARALQIASDVVHYKSNTRVEDFRFGDQVKKSFHWYGSFWSEALLVHLQPVIEQVTSKILFPTYSYTRIYHPGSKLEIHRDREECEYSATLTLRVQGADWPINFFDRHDKMQSFVVPQGSMMIYKGCELYHWRNTMPEDTELLYQLFLHYVDSQGPYMDRKFDRRTMLGLEARNI